MTIKSHSGPEDGLKVMSDALVARMPKLEPGLAAARQVPRAGRPVPFYHLPLDRIGADAPWQSAYRTGWRYPVIGGIRTWLADIRGTEGGRGSTFGGISQGILAERFLQASAYADEQLGDQAEEYEPRLLDVPALWFAALWLEGSTSRYFIPLLDGRPPGTAPLKMVQDILPILKARAEERSRGDIESVPGRDRVASGPTN